MYYSNTPLGLIIEQNLVCAWLWFCGHIQDLDIYVPM